MALFRKHEGRQVLELESRRIERLYRNMREVRGDEL